MFIFGFQDLRWSRGDVIVVPAWRPHKHRTLQRSTLFRVTDEPVFERLGLHRVTTATAEPSAQKSIV